MAGSPSHDGVIGVGSALQKARQLRGLLLEDAARDTKLRTDQLRALEDEDFEALGGEVYARAALRTYAAYLGLSSDKVMTAYLRHAEDPEPPPPPRRLGRVERAIAATRIRDNQRFLLIAAAFIVGVLLIFGLLSRDHATPPAAAIPTATPTLETTPGTIDATLIARTRAEITVSVDGEVASYSMRTGEQRAFSATDSLTIRVSDGGTVQVMVAGRDLGAPGEPGRPWERTFTYAMVSAWPSPTPTITSAPSESGSTAASSSASAQTGSDSPLPPVSATP
jgi:cytoskeleton protein RodZ